MRESYEVHFGNENEMPKCSSFDWIKSDYLCKHFFAIFEKYPSWPFDTLSSLYRNSPFLNLDQDVIPLIEQLPEINENKSEGEMVGEILSGEILYNDSETISEPLPWKKKFKSTKPGFFRKILKDVKDHSNSMTMYFQRLWNICSASEKYFSHQCRGKRSTIRTFKNGFKKDKFLPFTVALPQNEGTLYW